MKKTLTIILSTLFAALLLFPMGASAEESHEHVIISGGYYTELPNNQHSFTCECGETVVVDCIFTVNGYNSEEHWVECIYCSNQINRVPHTMQDCECTEETCVYQTHAFESGSLSPIDEYSHIGICFVCNQEIESWHKTSWGYDDTEHWVGCTCGYINDDYRETHELSSWNSYSWLFHYQYCYDCGFYKYEKHVDLDVDGYCDTEGCEYEVCIDLDGDHECDDCGDDDGFFCTDANGDHTCEECGRTIIFACADANGDHTCDLAKCARYMIELCEDEEYDYICDVCERNCCDHDIYDFESNGDGTHTGTCYWCETYTVEENCDDSYGIYGTDSGHVKLCVCGYEFEEEAHTYHEQRYFIHSLAGHFIACDLCAYEKYEAHKAESGTCDVCGDELTELFDVYVGGVGLKDGYYLSNAGKTSETKPSGGYAYYHEGVLELNGFSYVGEGTLWQDALAVGFQSRAALFVAKDVTLRLVGDNLLSCTFGEEPREDDETDLYGDGIAAVAKVTVVGDGSLTLLSTDDGINFSGSDFTVESGALTIGKLVRRDDGSADYEKGAGDDGIDLDGGNLLINGGTLHIVASDKGIYVSGTTIVNGGTLTVFAGDEGIDSNQGILIGVATVTVYAVNEEMTASRGDIRVQTVLEDIIPPVEENPTEELPTAEQLTEEHQTAEQPTEEHQTAEQPTEEQPTAEALQTEEASQTAESTPPVNENPPSTTEKEGFSLTAVILIAVSASIIVGLAAFLLALFINQKKTQVPKE